MPSFAAYVEAADRIVFGALGGQPVIYLPDVGDPVEVIGIFDAQYVLSKGGAEAGVESLGPAVFLRIEDLPVDPEADDPTLVINAASYRVTERRPDGMGGIVLALRLLT